MISSFASCRLVATWKDEVHKTGILKRLRVDDPTESTADSVMRILAFAFYVSFWFFLSCLCFLPVILVCFGERERERD